LTLIGTASSLSGYRNSAYAGSLAVSRDRNYVLRKVIAVLMQNPGEDRGVWPVRPYGKVYSPR
jgi:hypothetical protein